MLAICQIHSLHQQNQQDGDELCGGAFAGDSHAVHRKFYMAGMVLFGGIFSITAHGLLAEKRKHTAFDFRVSRAGSSGDPVLQNANAVWIKCVHLH